MSFEPIQRIETRVFARLPDRLRIKDRKSGWAFGKGSDTLHSFLEGPCFDRAGNLYVTDIPYGRILRVTPKAEWDVVAEYDGWPNGLAIHRDGRIFIAEGLSEFSFYPGEVRAFHRDNQRIGATRKSEAAKCWDKSCQVRIACKRVPEDSERIKIGDIAERVQGDPLDYDRIGRGGMACAYCVHFL